MLKIYPVTLHEAKMLTPRVKHFTLNLDDTVSFSYTPGQFITIHFEHQTKTLKRSYSIANAPSENRQIEFAAGYAENGPGSEYLFNLKPGDKVNISGPYGRLVLKENLPSRYILAATSTGITPYRAMSHELSLRLSNNPQLKVVIILGVQRHEDLIYHEDFQKLASQFPKQVMFRIQFSQVAAPDDKLNQFNGYVQHALKNINLDPGQDIVYLCGNPGMVDESFTFLKETGFTMQQIVREKYISSGSAAV